MTDPRLAPVTFVISGLVVGGAERVLTALANAWVEAGRPITIVTMDSPERAPFFPVDPRVRLRRLGLAGTSSGPLQAVANNLRRLIGLRRAINRSRPDVVISFMDRTNVLTLLATVGRPWPILVADRTARDPGTGRLWRSLSRIAYRRATLVIVQTRDSARAMPAHLRARTVAIPNPVLNVPNDDEGMAVVVMDPLLVVAVGRLVVQKGYDLLIEAFGKVVERLPRARLEIWGEGPERARLSALTEQLALGGSVTLCGETHQPAQAFRSAGLAVLSSRVEGFPNVLLEAMSLGRPVVAFDCTYGPADIVQDGIDGRLVPAGDVQAFADAIVDLLSSPNERDAMARRAVDVRTRFALATILSQWDQALDRAVDFRR